MLQNICSKKLDRVQDDKEAFDVFMTNHPRPTTDHQGGPRWHGSEAEYWFKKDLDKQENREMRPAELKESRTCYAGCARKRCAGHVKQEMRLRKLAPWLDIKGKTARDFDVSSESSEES